jgi:hypothetical protein
MPELEVAVAAGPAAPAAARRAVAGLFGGEPALAADVRLLVSEMVTNSVRHARLSPDQTIVVRLSASRDTVRVEVRDPGRWAPARPPTGPDRTFGWGLVIVDRLADRWGATLADGTAVWAELDRRRYAGAGPGSSRENATVIPAPGLR